MQGSLLYRTLLAVFLLIPGAPQEPEPTHLWKVLERAVEKEGFRAEFDAVLDHMRGIDARRTGLGNRLSRVNSGLAEPWTPPVLAAELRELLAKPATTRRGRLFSDSAAGIADWLDLDGYESPSPKCKHEGLRELDSIWSEVEDPERKGLSLLQSMSTYVELCHTLLDEALADLEPGDLAILFDGYPDFYEAWYRDHFPESELSEEDKGHITAFRKLLVQPRADRRLVLGVASALLRMAEPSFLASLPRRLSRVRESTDETEFGKDTRAVLGDEPKNRVVLSGRKPSAHSIEAALLIDLGGDDSYQRAAVVDSPEMLVSVVIDLGGDDRYSGDRAGPAFSAGGVALLVDRKGSDRYESTRLGQAASALGFSALVDLEGNDEYVAEDYSQGHATCGVALLYDLEGNDTYSAWAFAQGAGIGYGLCALVDGDGNDRYLADLHWPDVYGNSGPDVYHGASQGYATGMRSDIAGGIAALVDLGNGDDHYQAGSFSQGGGYFFSFGLMYDGGGDDENLGSRYAQGFGVHQGIGVRWDASGNDTYTCRSVAHAGMAWDEGVGFLLEDGGDDIYQTGDLSCGGAAQTGVAICLDSGGADIYRTGRESQGGTGSSEYHDKPALGVLIDLGGKKDEYSADGRTDTELRVMEGVQVFFDSKAKDMQQALKSKHLR